MSFSARWLALREPADLAARSAELLGAFAAVADGAPILDIGCGTGSTLRAVGLHVPRARWVLADLDPELLAEAARRHPQAQVVKADLNDLAALPVPEGGWVTASALFDLCSETFLRDLLDRLEGAGCGLYAALTYDGRMDWAEPHRLDAAVVATFNRHQRRDKGFGPALGPAAGATLAALAAGRGWEVRTASSPWHLTPGPLQDALLDGIAEVAGPDGWRAFHGRGSCTIGHLDLFLRPPRG